MNKAQLEKIISKHNKFKPISKFSNKEIDSFLKKLNKSINKENVVGVYDQSSFFKTKFILLTTNELYFYGLPVIGNEVVFNELTKTVNKDTLFIYCNNDNTVVYNAESKERKIIEDLLVDIMKVRGGEDIVIPTSAEPAFHQKPNVKVNTDELFIEAEKYKKNNDHQKAVEYYQKTADLGHFASINEIGLYLIEGQYIAQDIDKAIEYFKKCDDMQANYNLGMLYFEGKHVRKNYHMAYPYLTKAANLGNMYACEILYSVLMDERLFRKDLPEALQWLDKGIELGSEKCRLYKGGLYASGNIGNDAMQKGADILFEFAAKGHEFAKKLIMIYGIGNLPLTLERCELAIAYTKEIGGTFYLSGLEERLDRLLKQSGTVKVEPIQKEVKIETVKTNEMDPVSDDSDNDCKLSKHDLLFSSDTLYKRLGVQRIKDIVQYTIEHHYIPSKEYNDKLLELLEIMMDDLNEFDYVVDTVEELYDVYNSLVKKNTNDLYKQAVNEYNNKQYNEALEHFNQLYALDREDVAIFLGDIYYYGYVDKRDYNEALKWYKEASSSRGIVQRAECYMILGQVNDAKKTLANHLSSGNEVIECLVKYLLNDTFTYTDKMIPYIKKYLSSYSLNSDERRKLQSFIDEYDKVHLEENLLLEANYYFENDNIDKCIETYKECIAKCNSPVAMHKLALKYKNNLDDSYNYLAYLYKAIEGHDYPPAYYELALHYEKNKDMDNCIRCLEIAAGLGYSSAKSKLNQLRQPKVDKLVFIREPIKCKAYCSDCIGVCPIKNISRKGIDIVFGKNCMGCNMCVSACKEKRIKPVG